MFQHAQRFNCRKQASATFATTLALPIPSSNANAWQATFDPPWLVARPPSGLSPLVAARGSSDCRAPKRTWTTRRGTRPLLHI